MDWVLHNLKLLIAIAGAVAWAMNQRREAKARGTEPAKEATFDDPELAERTRRIREEIRRKIEQRAKAYTQPESAGAPSAGPAEPPTLVREVVREKPVPAPMPRAAVARIEAERTAGMLEQQAILTEQLRLADELRAVVDRRTQFETTVTAGAAEAAMARSALGDDLRNPDALRRAFILREVLGPPVALR